MCAADQGCEYHISPKLRVQRGSNFSIRKQSPIYRPENVKKTRVSVPFDQRVAMLKKVQILTKRLVSCGN